MEKAHWSVTSRVMLRTMDTVKTVRAAIEKIDSRIRIHHHKIKQFQPHVQFQFERGHFLVKTAESGVELEECLKLRFEVFHKEFMNKKRTFGVDIDKLDFLCDHLVIIDKRIGKTIGTYRLNCSRYTDTFYSSGEFHLDQVLTEPGYKLEMGRACIHKDYRNGAVMGLLWRGIAEYIQLTESKYLFGCASIKTMDKYESALIYKWLCDNGHMMSEYDIVPTRKYRFAGFYECLEYIEGSNSSVKPEAIRDMIPTLFHSYIRAGAKACGEPALDRDFGCVDFLILLKMDEMSPLFARKYRT